MKVSIQIIIVFIFSRAFSQEDLKDTTWFNSDWKETVKADASFYRVYKKTDKGYLVYDKYKNGRNQMVGEASAIKPELVMHGKTTYYDENGIRQKQGNYRDNKQADTWIYFFDNEKDSSVTIHKADGSEETIRKSRFQKDDEIYTIVETAAEFPGGVPGMMKYISSTTKYPDGARKIGVGGKAFLKFVIDENGDVDKVEIIKSTGVPELDEEAMRVVRTMPKWKPAMMTGRTVKCYFNLPFSFTMPEPYLIINTNNTNEKYVQACKALLANNNEKALDLYGQDTGDIEAWYNMAVIYFNKKNKTDAKIYFENVKNNITDQKNQYYLLSSKFLANNF